MTRMTSDVEPLYSALGGDADLAEIVEMFVAELPSRVNVISQHLETDLEAVRRAAHQLKGAAGSYGFDPVSRTAGEVEQAIVDRQPADAIRLAVEELIDLCERCRAGATEA